MPRIAYVVKRFPRLSETFIINELAALRRAGIGVEVFSLKPPEPQQQTELLASLDVPVWYLPQRSQLGRLSLEYRNYRQEERSGSSLAHEVEGVAVSPYPGKKPIQAMTLQLQAAVLGVLTQSRGFDHLHAHFASDAATVAMLASRQNGLSFSFTAHAKDIYHSYSDPEQDRVFLRRKLLEARFVVTVSDYNRRYLLELSQGRAEVHRIYNGVDLQRLSPPAAPRKQRLIVAVGRLVEKKGFRYLVEACGRLARQGQPFECVLIGEGPERAALEKAIAAYGIEDRVRLLGALPQQAVLQWIRRATVFVLPCVISQSGDRDGLPTVLLESLALATPAVSTPVAGIPEIIEEGVSGWLTPPGNGHALAETLREILSMPEEARRIVGERARQRAERLFDLHRNVTQLAELFASLAGMEDH